jgi:hypothetical protein
VYQLREEGPGYRIDNLSRCDIGARAALLLEYSDQELHVGVQIHVQPSLRSVKQESQLDFWVCWADLEDTSRGPVTEEMDYIKSIIYLLVEDTTTSRGLCMR